MDIHKLQPENQDKNTNTKCDNKLYVTLTRELKNAERPMPPIANAQLDKKTKSKIYCTQL